MSLRWILTVEALRRKEIRKFMIMKQKIISTLLIIFLTSFFSKAQKADCWSTFRGNQELQGKTTVQLPNSLKLLWRCLWQFSQTTIQFLYSFFPPYCLGNMWWPVNASSYLSYPQSSHFLPMCFALRFLIDSQPKSPSFLIGKNFTRGLIWPYLTARFPPPIITSGRNIFPWRRSRSERVSI